MLHFGGFFICWFILNKWCLLILPCQMFLFGGLKKKISMGLLFTRTCIHPLQYVHFHTQSLLCWFSYRYGSFIIMRKTLVSSVTTSFRAYSKRVLNYGLPQMCSAIFYWTEWNSTGHFLHSAIMQRELWSPKSPVPFKFCGLWVIIIITASGRFCLTALMICIVFAERSATRPSSCHTLVWTRSRSNPALLTHAASTGLMWVPRRMWTPHSHQQLQAWTLSHLCCCVLRHGLACSSPPSFYARIVKKQTCLSILRAVVIIICCFLYSTVLHSRALTVLHMFLVRAGLF